MINKRKSKRVNCGVPVDGSKDSLFDQTKIVDFSEEGIGCVSTHAIPISKEITVELDLNEKQEPVFAVGQVKWVRHVSNSDNFRIGMSFKKMLKGTKSRLVRFCSTKTG